MLSHAPHRQQEGPRAICDTLHERGPEPRRGSLRLHYQGGKTEDHALKNGVHFADYIRRVDVPESKYAYTVKGGQQVRYIKLEPKRNAVVTEIELIKNERDPTAPITFAITVETK